MSKKQTCPRRMEDFGPWERKEGLDSWTEGRYAPGLVTCNFCGSWNQDYFMAQLEDQKIALGPTDKDYKVYLHERLAPGVMEAKRDEWFDSTVGKAMIDHMESEEVDAYWERELAPLVAGPQLPGKFYFQHLSVEQRQRFVELVNAKQIELTYPGHFYVLPFFLTRAPG